MEMLYGTGYLSMGGDDEVANIVAQVDVAGKDVLDIGCGLGGALIALTRNHHARHAHGIDIDAGGSDDIKRLGRDRSDVEFRDLDKRSSYQRVIQFTPYYRSGEFAGQA